MPFEILTMIVEELLASHDSAGEPSIPSPITPLLYLSVFRSVARPILYRTLSLGDDVTFPSGRVRRACGSLRLARKTLQRFSKLAETETDAGALVKDLTVTRPDDSLHWSTFGHGDKVIKEEMNHHVQITRMCPALTDIHLDTTVYTSPAVRSTRRIGKADFFALSHCKRGVHTSFLRPRWSLRLSTSTLNTMQKLAGSSVSLTYEICFVQSGYQQS